MDFIPLYTCNFTERRTNLSIGLEIRYQTVDLLYLIHMLHFLRDEAAQNEGEIFLLPMIIANGKITSVDALLKRLNEISETDVVIKGFISIYFLDEMRPLFVAYCVLLETIKRVMSAEFEWDEEHAFYQLYQYFEANAGIYFPPKRIMH